MWHRPRGGREPAPCASVCAHACVRQDREGHTVGVGHGEAELHLRGVARKAGGEVTFGQAWEEAGSSGGKRDANQRTAGTARGRGPRVGPGGAGRGGGLRG